MALTPERISRLATEAHIAFCLGKHGSFEMALARAIEAEVRKQDEALIRQMLEALETAGCYPPSSQDAITAARARLQS